MSTRLQTKRKRLETIKNAPAKRARVELMKKLAIDFNDANKSKKKNYFTEYYDTKKLLFPWLQKETLRWHIRKSKMIGDDSSVISQPPITNTRELNSQVSFLLNY